MKTYNHFDYCMRLLQELKANIHPTLLKAFGVEQLEQFRQQLSSVEGLCMVAVDAAEQDFSRRDSDNFAVRSSYSIVLLAPAQLADTELIFDAVNRTNHIAQEIVRRILQDAINPQAELYARQPSDITIQGVGPIGDHFFGTIISFKIITNFPFVLNADLWQ